MSRTLLLGLLGSSIPFPGLITCTLFGSSGNKAPYMSSIRGHTKRGKKMELPAALPK
jgi:hypothetical protein